MSLRLIAEQDLGFILEGDAQGFRWPITLINPDGLESTGLTGLSDDIAQMIDPDTGQAVSGRLASATLRLSSVYDQFPDEGIPKAIADTTGAPWLVRFDDINGNTYTFKISESNPDRALGTLVLLLETYVE